MKLYEISLLTENEDNIKIAKTQLEKSEVKIIEEQFLGQKKLYYPIRKKGLAYLTTFWAEIEPIALMELSKELRQTSEILRFVIIKSNKIRPAPLQRLEYPAPYTNDKSKKDLLPSADKLESSPDQSKIIAPPKIENIQTEKTPPPTETITAKKIKNIIAVRKKKEEKPSAKEVNKQAKTIDLDKQLEQIIKEE